MSLLANNVLTSLADDVSIGASSIMVDAGAAPRNTPPDPGGLEARITLMDRRIDASKIEIITYTGLTDNLDGTFTLTGVTKAQENTSDQAWSAGDYVIQAPTAGFTLSPELEGLEVSLAGYAGALIRNRTETIAQASHLSFLTGSGAITHQNYVGGIRGVITDANPNPLKGKVEVYVNAGDSNTLAATFADTGKVGIGTGSPATWLEISTPTEAPSLQLKTTGAYSPSIIGDANRTGSNDQVLGLKGYWNGNNIGTMNFMTGADFTNKDDGYIRWQTAESGVLSEKLRLTQDGKLVIGTDIASPGSTLEINKTTEGPSIGLVTSGDYTPRIRGDANRNVADERLLQLAGQWNGTSVALIQFLSGADFNNKDDGYLAFHTSNSGSLLEAMRITQDRKLGIGTADPDGKLHVMDGGGADNADIQIGNYASYSQLQGGGMAMFGNNVKAGESANQMVITTTHGSLGARAILMSTAGITFHGQAGSVTAGNPFVNEHMRIDDTGKVGIGTTAGLSYDFEVYGNKNDQQRAVISNASTGSAAGANLSFRNDMGVGAAIFKYSSNGVNYGGANSFNIINVSDAPLTLGADNQVKMTIYGDGKINMANLPTSASGLSAGDLWNDSGTVKIA